MDDDRQQFLRLLAQLRPLLNHRARGMGRRLVGTRGAGKTRLLSLLAFIDLVYRVPSIVIDPAGALSLWLLSDIEREPLRVKQALLPRLRYYNMAGLKDGSSTIIPTFPLLFRRGDEPLQEIAQRPLEVWSRLDPQLVRAPRTGRNAMLRAGSMAGMLLFAMDPPRQLTEAESLLTNPTAWASLIRQAQAAFPDDLAEPARFFLESYPTLRDQEREMRVGSLRDKLLPFSLNPVLRGIYGADDPVITVDQIEQDRLFVILDFSDLTDADQRRFAILWVYAYCMEAFRARGAGKDQLPIAFYVDEASYILPSRDQDNPLLRDQIRHLRELILALDQRVPHIERIGEADIASEAAALKQRALDRLRELERQ